MSIEPFTIGATLVAIAVAIGALAARDQVTPMRDLVRANLAFILAAGAIPLVLLQFVAPALAHPWRAAITFATAFAWCGLGLGYLTEDRDIRGVLLGALGGAIGTVIAAVWLD